MMTFPSSVPQVSALLLTPPAVPSLTCLLPDSNSGSNSGTFSIVGGGGLACSARPSQKSQHSSGRDPWELPLRPPRPPAVMVTSLGALPEAHDGLAETWSPRATMSDIQPFLWHLQSGVPNLQK